MKWIFFDVGSTLVDETKAYDHRAREMLAGTDVTFEEFDAMRIALAKQGLDGNSAAIKHFGLKKTPWHPEDERLFPDTADTLSYLKEHGYRLGIIANQVLGTEERLDAWGIGHYFDVIAASAELGVAKPDPAIFEKAFQMAGCRAEEAVMVGDRLDNDILPAKAVGMKTIWIRKGLSVYQTSDAADWTIDDLRELKNYFSSDRMNNVNKTLYIPLYGKSYVSQKGIILHDPKAEEIWAAEGFPLKGKSRSKWLAYYMGMRAAVFDCWLKQAMDADPLAIVLHIGCGMDSRCERVGTQGHLWLDIDFPDVISERKRYYQERSSYKMLSADVRSADWLAPVSAGNAIVIMEGVSMYLRPEELTATLAKIAAHFEKVSLLMDCYTEFAAKASKVRNPINDVGVTQVYGLDNPKLLEGNGIAFVREHEMTPANLVDELHGMEKKMFKALFAGSIAKKMYRLYEYKA